MNDNEEQSLAERVVSEMMSRDALSRQFGMEIVSVRPNAASVRMRVRADMLNGFGVCHGGVTFSLADSALAFASNTGGAITMSIENSMTYPKKIFEGDVLTADAEQESGSSRLGFFRVAVRREPGDVVALFRGTVYRTNTPYFKDPE